MTVKTLAEWIAEDSKLAPYAGDFRAMYGMKADQQMDRGTLDLMLKQLPQHEPPPEVVDPDKPHAAEAKAELTKDADKPAAKPAAPAKK